MYRVVCSRNPFWCNLLGCHVATHRKTDYAFTGFTYLHTRSSHWRQYGFASMGCYHADVESYLSVQYPGRCEASSQMPWATPAELSVWPCQLLMCLRGISREQLLQNLKPCPDLLYEMKVTTF